MDVRRLVAADAAAYWSTRNRGLKEFPDAFTTSHAEGLKTTPETLARRFGGDGAGDGPRDGSDDFVLGAFTEKGLLVGYAGFQREGRAKNRHKGTLIGMYVIPEHRGCGLGRRLLDALIVEARALGGVEQINLTVTRSNAGARGLYLAAGFASFGVEPYALKVDGVYYAKEHMSIRL